MTEPTPAPEPLLTKARLATWAQENPLSDPDLADLIIDAVSTLLWLYGDSAWTATTMPARARDIGYIVAKDYYLNPRQLRQETIGPLQESVNDSVLGGISLTEAQQAELAVLADSGPAIGGSSLWALSTTRGDETTMYPGRAGRGGNVVLWDSRGAWPIEYLDESEGDVFGLND